ncbi:MAG: hypothetical protein KDC53_00085 [Saprospiraceae bacterium]|nr:hypothetical protein [Saprospiraceae bacterium]
MKIQQNTILVSVVLVCLSAATVWYYKDNSGLFLYKKYHTDLYKYFGVTRSGSSGQENQIQLILEKAVSSADYERAIEELLVENERNPENDVIQYYLGLFDEELGHDWQAIQYFQNLRFNSDLYGTTALRRISMLFIKHKEWIKAQLMLTELYQLGDDQDRNWVKEIAQKI